MSFTHLHLHTTYSLLDGQCSIKGIVAKAKALGMTSLAVTDHGNLFALKAFYDECLKKENGLKPILGVEAYVVDHDYRERHEYFAAHPGLKEKRFHLCLHAKNLVGYHNLVRLMSEAHINGKYMRPRIDHALLEKYHEGLHCSSACIAGEIAYYLDTSLKGGNDPAKAEEIARWYQGVFGGDYSLEVMAHPTVKRSKRVEDPVTHEVVEEITEAAVLEMQELYVRQRAVNEAVFALAKKLGIRVVATNDVHFLEKEDDDSHDVLLALSTGTKLSDPKRMIYTGQEYFKTEEEMLALFPDHPEAITATQEVADKVEVYKLDSDPIMPKFPIPESFGTEADYAKRFTEEALRAEFTTEDKPKNFERLGGYEKVLRIKFEADYLQHLVYEGAVRRWGDPVPAEIGERLDFELGVIKTMGFPGYFLIVNDYIANARKMGVWVGPGRGSAAGAAVAYALGITNVDPIKYDLLFERFLNPDRISMPDIDVDFDDAGRGKVLEFVTRKYGQDHVAHIVTFGQMAAKSVIKDVGRAMAYPLADTNKLVKLVPDTPKTTFRSATSEKDKKGNPNKDYSPGLVAAFNSEDPTIHALMARARRLEGGMRQPGIHACGVIISRDPLIETIPVMPTEGESLLTTQYDGHFVEPVGLLKMDFLGLKTLTVEKECVAILGKDNPRVPGFLRGPDGFLNPDNIPDDDPETYALFGRGETTGLFQFESDGMKKWLMALQPEKLTDLVAMNALYRPGPMDYIPTFVRRKKGEEPIHYDHPLMEKYLKDTYGVCVYQEQVMLLSRLLGGFTRGMSDALRKAMGKKKLDVMEELKVKFVDGCLKNPEFRIGEWADESRARRLIDKIWDDWRAFASYAFNKSHAVCYAWIAYQTGYLKAHYPAEFMCAQISSEIGNFDKLPGFVAEAQEMGLDLRLPDVNESGPRFVPTPDAKGIRYGLSGIKGVGAAGELIVAERERNGPYRGFLNFCLRLAGTQACNKRVLENLTRTGAFSTLEPNRGKLFLNIEYALKRAQQKARDAASDQMNFFDMMAEGGEEKADDAELRDAPAFAPAEDLKNERDYLGVYISGHPIQSCRKVISSTSECCLRTRSAGAREDTLSFQPFALEKIAKKPVEEEDAAAEDPAGEGSVPADDAAPLESDAGPTGDEDDLPPVAAAPALSPIDELLMKSKDDDWQLKGLARNIVRAKNEVQWSDKKRFDAAVAREKARLARRFEAKELDPLLLKRLEIRVTAILDGCSIKVSKPRGDMAGGAKWAILSLDDGTGQADAFCYAKPWEKYGAALEGQTDQLVMVCGEVTHRTHYEKEDALKEHPSAGDISFTVKEVYPVGTALGLLSKGIFVNIDYSAPEAEARMRSLQALAAAHPGNLPLMLRMSCPGENLLVVDSMARVDCSLAFLSALGKLVPAADVDFPCEDKILLAPREPKPWER